MKQYDSTVIEKKWQDYWREQQTYKTLDSVDGKKNFYALSEFAYPSGNLHVGHWYAFAVPDIYARYKRMSGHNVLYPMGFDAFGLPAENAAIKHGLDPRKWTYKNMEYMQNQLQSMGASFDWERRIMTCDPGYYKWTQWMFNQFFKNDLVYRASTKTNWCESCKTVLANEQVTDGKCERCGNQTIQKDMNQWMLRITQFADALHDDLDTLPWDHSIKQAQREWIGRKEGSNISFPITFHSDSSSKSIPVFGELVEGSVLRPVVKIILRNSKKEILLLKKGDRYDLPGGGIDDGESVQEAGIRELREETTYTNFSFVKKIYEIKAHYKALSDGKDINSQINIDLYDLVDDVLSEKKLDKHEQDSEMVWVSENDVLDVFTKDTTRSKAIFSGIEKYISSKIDVFTTRADTLFGVTYVVLAPEHSLVNELKVQIQNWDEVQTYLDEVAKKSDLDRQQSKEKTGVELRGVTATNPATGQEVPIWIADYVLAHFGTGAVMAVPAHDERDCEFALKYNLPFKFVILPSAGDIGNSRPLEVYGETAGIKAAGAIEEPGQKRINAEWNYLYDILSDCPDGILSAGKRFCTAYEGKLINSPGFNTQTSEDARKNITESVGGAITKTYRLRDWGISRQRYWGTPIPIVYDPQGKAHAVPDENLPWLLPEDVDFTPDGTAPLARSEELKNRTIEIFGEGWTPEVDTMDTFVDSSWYFYRYLDPQNTDEFTSREFLENWMPVDMYFGGAEHTTMHLLYSRFWVKALYSLGLVPANEPYKGRLNRGLILGPDGNKMSKSKGNVIDPDEVVGHVGADAVRMYLAFIGPFNEPGNYPWDPNGVVGVRRFIERVWRLSEKISSKESPIEIKKLLHKTLKKVTEDIERLKLNTAISSMMIFVNSAEKELELNKNDYESLVKMFGTFAPHAAEEIWQELLGNINSIHRQSWPKFDESFTLDDEITLGIQINGKIRSEITIPLDIDLELLKKKVLSILEVQKWVSESTIKKFIYVPGKIINIVI